MKKSGSRQMENDLEAYCTMLKKIKIEFGRFVDDSGFTTVSYYYEGSQQKRIKIYHCFDKKGSLCYVGAWIENIWR